MDSSKVAGAFALAGMLPSIVKAANLRPDRQYTVQQVIDIILKAGDLKPISGTVDTLKSGSPDMIVTGIITTMFATITVIEKAAALGANFIIAHEPTFYNHVDNKDFVKDNPVVQQKLALLNKYKITIWRFHDYIHSLKPDAIGYGVLKKSGWLSYYKSGSLLIVPRVSLQQMVQHLKTSLSIAHLRVIGNLDQQCTRVSIIPGAAGLQKHITAVLTESPDVLIVGEVSEWETAEFIRDGNLLGRKTALIVLGHSVSEEPGMEYIVDWLSPKLPGIKITHITSGDPFVWL